MVKDAKQRQYALLQKKWESLGIASDIMFGMVMEKRELCLELIRRAVPQLNVQEIKFHQHQYTVDGPIDARGSRFDVYAQDDQGHIFVIEMQVANRHNLPYRLRYYQSQLDFDILGPGEGFEKLATCPTYVIIFCDFDYYGKGRVQYEFENRDYQDHDLTAGDGLHEIIFNAKASTIHDNMKIKSFLQLMENQVDSQDQFVTQIMETMKQIKANPERRRNFMTYEMNLMDARSAGRKRGLAEGREEGLAEGREEGLAEGRKEGLAEGHKEGLTEGHKQGLAEGRKKGLIEGHEQGLVEGRKKGLVEGHEQGLTEGHKQGLAEGHKQGLAEGRKKALAESIPKVAKLLQKYEPDRPQAVKELMTQFNLTQQEAEKYFNN
ncbi:Rpn family recombination-promoting nuclease/putative transposase [uncultured Limosilactobacillus sp.]|uniref:Rpn family recombination-promoting nuclease/putative transposase n=1 Tax=uncultured Limosilactobacillus sp. TaxID=2837629 RepID=UPI0025E5155E|nr:Rpn family recombination-promoting nuclease/putative transposase [uncultured Limosilactobacillus sp.]